MPSATQNPWLKSTAGGHDQRRRQGHPGTEAVAEATAPPPEVEPERAAGPVPEGAHAALGEVDLDVEVHRTCRALTSPGGCGRRGDGPEGRREAHPHGGGRGVGDLCATRVVGAAQHLDHRRPMLDQGLCTGARSTVPPSLHRRGGGLEGLGPDLGEMPR